MPDTLITDLTAGNPAQSADELVVNRSGADRKVTAGSIASLAGGQFVALKYLNVASTQFAGSLDASNDTTITQISAGDSGFTAVNVSGCTALTKLGAVFATSLASVNVTGCAALVGCFLEGCALNQAAVDSVLVALNNNGASNGEVTLNEGTNAAPSATGLAAKTSLEGRGWTVTVTP